MFDFIFGLNEIFNFVLNVKTRTVCVTVFAVKKGVFDFDKGLGVEGGSDHLFSTGLLNSIF